MSAFDDVSSRIGGEGATFNEESFQAFLSQRNGEPSWLRTHRADNWRRLLGMPDPSRKDEHWRFGDPRRLALGKCAPSFGQIGESDVGELKQASNLVPSPKARIILANDRCIEEADLPDELHHRGVVFESLESAILKRPDELRRHLEIKQYDLGSAKQRALHASHLRNGAYLRIPPGVVIEEPLIIYHWIKGSDVAIFPRTIITAEKNSQVTLVEVYLSADIESNAFASAVVSIEAATEANVTRIAAQNWNHNTVSCLLNSNYAERDALIRNFAILLGSKVCRQETHLKISEPGGDVRVRSMVVADDDQLFDQRSRQDHQAERTCSDVLCKNALLDESRSIFGGLIRVEENAQLTNAHQTNRNLVIGPTAETHTLPELEIFANDVKCSHGATTGKIDEEQLFYLQSRGIPRETARQLLTLGFFEEILTEIPNELADALRILFRAKLEGSWRNEPSSR